MRNHHLASHVACRPLAGAFVLALAAQSAVAAVTTTGAVPNAPPVGGGAVSGSFVIGDGAYGSVVVDGGTPIASSGTAVLGDDDSVAFGVLELTGFGSDWTVSGSTSDLFVGDEGRAVMKVAAGAIVTLPDDTVIADNATSQAQLLVTGNGSRLDNNDNFTVGNFGSGSVEVADGAALDSDTLTLGSGATGAGTVTVQNSLSQWTTSPIVVGAEGRGRLEVLDGAQVTAVSLIVAEDADAVGDVLVAGNGARLAVADAVTLAAGEGSITVGDGGVIASNAASIAATGRITLAGGRWESTHNSDAALSLGGLLQGSGTVDVQGITINAAAATRGRMTVDAGDRIHVTGRVINNGLVELAGGELQIDGDLANAGDIAARHGAVLRVGDAGLINASGSHLAITAGTVDVFGLVTNSSNAEITVTGGASGVFHDGVTNSGTIFVSATSEIALLDDLAFTPASTAAVQIGSHLSSGLLAVGGSSTLAGTLAVTMADGYVPALGDTFEVLQTSTGLSNAFTAELLPELGGGLELDVTYTSHAVVLSVIAAGGDADFDNDGDVDGADLAQWQSDFGVNANSDATGDGVTDGRDFLAWQRQFGTAAIVAGGSVPEPAAVVLLLTAIALGRLLTAGEQGIARRALALRQVAR